ncbi:DUF4136 domain-containing protein [Caenimonas aquaedulcis]|uniref:DUF4136 domain-containing protein n=1 Tax=Caenimonas aquaedulcis TaxID=2793270 RepID=A0A931MIU8_9BURK|nr:DUF4136 domain-containing protein [Caenimonas aquaedulcis]MBG9389645.1 DUF4136 domain-containing protein [Caenimonas aquaedulcis]
MKSTVLRLCAAPLAACALLLAGCATSIQLDNTVQSFSSLPALPSPATYRFERLPSQQAPQQVEMENLADPALHKAGLSRDDANPRFSVQITARLQPVLSPWSDPWGGFAGWGRRGRGFGFGIGGRLGDMESPWYHREVGVVVRELSSGKVVFESRASNDGPWSSNTTVFPAMFEAALQGFPNAPAGPRQVNIQVAS